jgi:hypothetical protein
MFTAMAAEKAKKRRKLVLTPVAVEKLLSAKFLKTKLRQDALQTTLLVF